MADDIRNRPSPLTSLDAAKQEAARAVIAAAPREPHALDFVLKGDRFVVAKGTADDIAAAADRQVIARQQTVREKLHDLAQDIGNRLDNQDGWRPLPRQLQRLREALDVAADQLPDRIGRIYDLSASLASFVDLDNDLTADPLATENPLPPDIRRALRDAVATLAVWVRSFPSARAADDEAGAFLNRPERFETVRENLPATRKMIETARDIGALSDDDAADALIPVETAESAPRGGVQAEKAGHRALATGRSFLKAFAGAVFALNLGALGSALESQVPLYDRIVAFALRVPDETARIARTMPADLRVAVEEGLRGAREIAEGGMLPVPLTGPLPRPPATQRAEPPPDFDLDEVKRLIVAGTPPPNAWVPFIFELGLRHPPLTDLAPVAGLVALRRLDLTGNEVSDITPLTHLAGLQILGLGGTRVRDIGALAHLSELRELWLNQTQAENITPLARLSALRTLDLSLTLVSDIAPLAGLSGLQALLLGGTRVSDIAPLAGLAALQSLNLSGTQVSDIAPLAGLANLRSLSLSGTQVSDFSPLASLSKLLNLFVSEVDEIALAPLAHLTELEIKHMAEPPHPPPIRASRPSRT
ncbi:leucine-rich repeat domain-containing protein [Elioraea sp.]|uniref:leucine-rich repeat domain-containing protein n=1 Tax=Elioraea sp. TaxID=2185103 RepID=UPI0025BF9B07|nr:leucine-rich repeat domain-containing protein [Elioraea sp.]